MHRIPGGPGQEGLFLGDDNSPRLFSIRFHQAHTEAPFPSPFPPSLFSATGVSCCASEEPWLCTLSFRATTP